MREVRLIAVIVSALLMSMVGIRLSAAAGDPIKIGVVTSRSGVLQEWGTQEIRGLELGLEYATKGTGKVLDRDVKLIIEDDASKPEIGVQKAIKLLSEDKVNILTGAINSAVALAVQQKAKESKVPYIVSCASDDAITGSNFNKYTFRIGRSLRQATLAGSQYIVQNVGKKIALLAPDYAGGRAFAADWKEDMTKNGAEIVLELYAPLTTTDFTSYLQRIKHSKADALMLIVVGANFTNVLPKQIVELGVNKEMKVAADLADIAFFKALDDAGVGMVGTCMYYYELFDNPLNQWLVENHKKKFNAPPELWAGNSFATGIAITAAIEKAGTVKADDLVKALEGLEFFGPKTTSEKMRIRAEDHQTMQGVPVVQLGRVSGRDYPAPKLLFLPTAEQCTPPVIAPTK